MRLNFRHGIGFFFLLLLVTILATETTWRICEVCSVQEHEKTLFGKKIEFISLREYDEFGTYAKWQEENGNKPHEHHIWVEIKEFPKDLLE